VTSPEISTKRHWLLVLPASARLKWRGGEAATDGYQTCLDTITRSQHLKGTAPLAARFLSVQPGDVLWLALRDIGVIGRGAVETVHGRPEADVGFTVDPDASTILVTDPIPARHMGKVAVGLSEAAPTAVHDQPAAVEAFEWWWRELGTLDARRLKVLDDIKPARETRGWGRRIAEHPVLGAASRTLRAAGLSLGTPGRTSALDLVGLDKSRVIGVSVMSGTSKQATDEALTAFGHGMHHLRELQQSLDDAAVWRSFWIAFPSVPDADLVEFLEESGSNVVWLEHATMRSGPLTAEDLTELARSSPRGLD
jgi:hypothetical protein